VAEPGAKLSGEMSAVAKAAGVGDLADGLACVQQPPDDHVLYNAERLSGDDTQAVIAHIRSVPAAGEQTPNQPDQLNPLGVAMLGAGMLPSGKPVITSSITAPPKGLTFQFGEYILSYHDCRGCYGPRLTGGVPEQMGPLGPDLNLVKDWKLAEFIATMRTYIDPNGHELSKQMPWRPIGRIDNDELAAVYEFLTHLPGS
jgi:hypothetical protein